MAGLHFANAATGSDNEAVLAATVADDLDALADLRGMFAFEGEDLAAELDVAAPERVSSRREE